MCMRYSGESAEETIKGIHVHRFRPSIWKRLRNSVEDSHRHPRLERFIEVFQKAVTVPLYPQTLPITASLFFRAAKKLQSREKFDLIVSEYHELESLLTGCRLMREFTGLKHAAILWDPVRGQIATTYLPASYTGNRIGKLEDFVNAYASLQISMSSMRPYFVLHGDKVKEKRVFLDIPGVREPEPETPTGYLSLLKEGCINVVFSGLLSPLQRDPLPIIRLLNSCDFAFRINLVFFSMGAKEAIEAAAGTFKGRIVHHDYIPLEELHSVYRHADYLLNVSHINHNMVPSKIFEYMSFGKPVISTFVTDGDAAAGYLESYPESLCLDLKQEEEVNVAALNAFLSTEHKPVCYESVKRLFPGNVPDTYLKAMDDLLST